MTGVSGAPARSATQADHGGTGQSRVRALDGLRGVAVLMVVVSHGGLAGQPTALGAIGVAVFFVLSGYLISRVVLEARRGGTWSMRGFVAARAARLLPALLLMQAGVLAWLASTGGEWTGVWLAVAASAFYVQNIVYNGVDVNLFIHTWSLAVEEQFYLVWPLVLPWLARLRRPLAWVGVLVAGSLLLRLVVAAEGGYYPAYYSLPTNAFALLMGGLLAIDPPTVPGGRVQRAIPVVGVVAIVGVAQAGVPSPEIVLPVVGAMLAAGVLAFALPGAPLLEGPVLRFAGRISYALYVWHFPVLQLAGELHGGLSALPWLLLSVALATASTLLVEEPVRQWWRSRGRTARSRWSPMDGTLVPTSSFSLPHDRRD